MELAPLSGRSLNSDPDADDLEPVLVGIEAAEALAEDLADAVERVRAHRVVRADPLARRVHARRVVAAREDDAANAEPPCRLEDVVGGGEVRLEQMLERVLGRDSRQMDDRYSALECVDGRVHLPEIGRDQLPLP